MTKKNKQWKCQQVLRLLALKMIADKDVDDDVDNDNIIINKNKKYL